MFILIGWHDSTQPAPEIRQSPQPDKHRLAAHEVRSGPTPIDHVPGLQCSTLKVKVCCVRTPGVPESAAGARTILRGLGLAEALLLPSAAGR